MALITAPAESRYSMRSSGGPSAMMTGTWKMPPSCVNILGAELLYQPLEALVLEQELVPSGWMVLIVQGQKLPSANVQPSPGGNMTVPILKMLV